MSNTETSHSYRNANATHFDTQAQAFLDRFGIKFRATLSDSKVAPWNDGIAGDRHHYRVCLSKGSGKPDRVRNFGDPKRLNRLVFDFFGSIADCADGKHPTPYDVLACISSDASMDTEFTGFGEWCDNYGFDRDSIKALQTYRRCSAFAKRLQSFFTREEIEALQEIQ